jgi:hypothetical protein
MEIQSNNELEFETFSQNWPKLIQLLTGIKTTKTLDADGVYALKHISRFAQPKVLPPSLHFVNVVIITTKPTNVKN